MNQGNSHFDQFEIGGDDTTSFQPIDAGHVGTGAMDNAAFPPANPLPLPPSQQQQQQQQNQNQNPNGGMLQKLTSCCNIGSLQSYFDVDTEDVQERVLATVLHLNKPDYFVDSVLRKQGKSADLYGPVWITLACIFLFAVTSNTSKYLHTESLDDFEYDISHLTHATYILSFYTFLLPLILFLIFKTTISIPLSLMELISIYGYSLVPYIPTTVLCSLIPSRLLEWIFLFGATGISVLFILRNVGGPIARSSRAWSGPLMLVIMGCHLIFFFVLKWTFYRHRYHGSNAGDGTSTDDGNGGDGTDDASLFDDALDDDMN